MEQQLDEIAFEPSEHSIPRSVNTCILEPYDPWLSDDPWRVPLDDHDDESFSSARSSEQSAVSRTRHRGHS